MFKRIVLFGLKIIGIFVLLIIVVGALFVNTSPEFGGKPSKAQIAKYEMSGHYNDGVFENLMPTSLDMDFDKVTELLSEFMEGIPNARPDYELPMNHLDSLELVQQGESNIIWFGHSAFLLQMDGKNILLDPMFGDVPAPHPWLGQKRYSSTLPISIEKMPKIDAVIISHDHYDHLDYGSIEKLKGKTDRFFVPYGVAAHFIEWGIEESRIVEMNWWEDKDWNDLKISLVPSRHFSGRGIADRNSTLWGAWVIEGQSKKIFFSGDGGYGAHFKEIGEKYGPFDLGLMECGQYNEKWDQIHMMPEQSAQAGLDIKAKVIMPIHWGAFTLALHSWTDPVERITKKAKELGIPVITPIMGDQVNLNKLYSTAYSNPWWMN